MTDTKRAIVTCRKLPYEERTVAHVGDVMETFSDVHFAEDASVGSQVSYSVDLNPDDVERFERATNLIDIVMIGDYGLGAADSEPDTVAPEFDFDTSYLPTEKFWSRSSAVLDQGSEGACVGFAATNFLNVAPMKSKLGNSDALGVYNRARQIDQFPGTTHSGSSVSAGCGVLKERGFIESYASSQSERDIEAWVKTNGPVMMSMAWCEGMYRTDYRGFIRPTGRVVGGHAILLTGMSKWGSWQLFNSWGRDFGDRGIGWLAAADRPALRAIRSVYGYMAKQTKEV